jgi:hypothetical protein
VNDISGRVLSSLEDNGVVAGRAGGLEPDVDRGDRERDETVGLRIGTVNRNRKILLCRKSNDADFKNTVAVIQF